MPALHVRLLFPAFILLALVDLLAASPQGSRSPSPSGRDILTLRALVSTRDAGVIIGKGGKNVADLREQTGVKAGVSRVVTGIHERVLSISGTVESVAKVR
jgi:heterogeneous nuclear rnp K-like protein 2